LIINNFVDVAEYVGADGVHLGQLDTPVLEARARLGNRAIIGLSIETMRQAELAQNLPIDYLGVSTVYASRIKPHDSHWGEEGLAGLRANTDQCLVGIGGIKHHNVDRVISAGADGAAVVSAIYAAEDPRRAAQDMRTKIEQAKIALAAGV
ncbi:MAG TPA: thiamine phosphate synthase, partial [Candidatus Saccharimonadales bacterium]|nr:thiamine phosphate synthase [Candidatus Saccharimonadales bacterium]